MINILHTIDTTGPGGAETVFINLIKGLDSKKHRSFAAIRGLGWVCDTLQENGIEPIFVNSRGKFNVSYLLELIKILRKHEINIIQSHLLGSNLYCSLAGLICRVPVVSTFHGFVDTSDRERFMPLKSQIINFGSNKIVFVSNRLREHYIKNYGISSKKAVTIYNGVDTSVFYPLKDDSIRKELGLGKQHVLIGALGNIRPAKGYDVFLKAARLVAHKHPECRFIIAGQGSGALFESLLKLRKVLELEEVFFIVGFRKDAAKVLNNLDIFVLPSVSEGFSISTIEAMACGIPVIVTRSGGPEEIVTNNETGIVVECDEKELANGIINIVENAGLRKKIVQLARFQTLEKFSLSAMITNYVNLYQVGHGTRCANGNKNLPNH